MIMNTKAPSKATLTATVRAIRAAEGDSDALVKAAAAAVVKATAAGWTTRAIGDALKADAGKGSAATVTRYATAHAIMASPFAATLAKGSDTVDGLARTATEGDWVWARRIGTRFGAKVIAAALSEDTSAAAIARLEAAQAKPDAPKDKAEGDKGEGDKGAVPTGDAGKVASVTAVLASLTPATMSDEDLAALVKAFGPVVREAAVRREAKAEAKRRNGAA